MAGSNPIGCPFCNGEAVVFGTEEKGFYVECLSCPCALGRNEGPSSRSWFDSKTEAVTAWNLRAQNQGE